MADLFLLSFCETVQTIGSSELNYLSNCDDVDAIAEASATICSECSIGGDSDRGDVPEMIQILVLQLGVDWLQLMNRNHSSICLLFKQTYIIYSQSHSEIGTQRKIMIDWKEKKKIKRMQLAYSLLDFILGFVFFLLLIVMENEIET